MQSGRSNTKDSGDFLKKIKNVGSLPENAILVTADVVALCSNTPHKAGLQALEEAVESRNQQVSTGKPVKMAQFVLRKNLFEFNNVFQQISVQQLGQNLHRHRLVFSWIKLKIDF